MFEQMINATNSSEQDDEKIPPGTFHAPESDEKIPPGTFHGADERA